MPWTLYRYILKDIAKLLVLATTVMIVVLGFGAAIKPLSDGLLDTLGLLRFLGAITPTMLQYALPFSTAFAVTLVFSRLATENELTAMSAGGLSYARILLPVGTLGAALGVFLFVMANWVLPAFNRQALQLVQKDVIKAVVAKLEAGESVRLGKMVVYADRAQVLAPPTLAHTAVQPDQLIVLQGVAAGELDMADLRMVSHHTAEAAEILVFRDAGRTWVQLRLKDAQYQSPAGDGADQQIDARAHLAEELPNIELPTRHVHQMRAMSWPELVRLTHHPDNHPHVARQRRLVVDAMAAAMIQQEVRRSVASSFSAEARGAPRSMIRFDSSLPDEHFELWAASASVNGPSLTLRGGADAPVLLVQYQAGAEVRRFEARGGVELEALVTDDDPEPRLVIAMKSVRIVSPRLAGGATEQSRIRITRLRWPAPVRAALAQRTARQLIESSKTGAPLGATAQGRVHYLEVLIGEMLARVQLEFHLRAATSLACLLGAMLGALATMRFRHILPLVVFFWVFLSIVVVISVMQGGRQVGKSNPEDLAWGIGVLWSGVMAMAAVNGLFYARLSRN